MKSFQLLASSALETGSGEGCALGATDCSQVSTTLALPRAAACAVITPSLCQQ